MKLAELFERKGSGKGNYAPRWAGDSYANLDAVINRVSNEIARKTRKGGANWMVVTPMIISVLQTANKSKVVKKLKHDKEYFH